MQAELKKKIGNIEKKNNPDVNILKGNHKEFEKS